MSRKGKDVWYKLWATTQSLFGLLVCGVLFGYLMAFVYEAIAWNIQ